MLYIFYVAGTKNLQKVTRNLSETEEVHCDHRILHSSLVYATFTQGKTEVPKQAVSM